MPIALALPFAEAAGIAVAGLSAAAIANKVSEYIKLNPEDSMMILKMINPASGGAFAGEGLSTLFKKKAKTEKEPSIEDLEEIGEDLSQSDKAKVMKAYGKSKGADKRQRMIDIAKKLGLAGEGKERQKSFDEVEGRYEDSDFEEERTKPKFDYTKFFKANGGRIGYQEGGGIINSFQNIINETLGNLYNRDKISQLEYEAGRNYGYTNTASGPVSDFRHQAAMNELSKSLGPNALSNVSFIPSGDTLAFGAGLINEIPALFRGLDPQNLKEIGEDIVSNFKGTYLTSNKETPESIYQNIFSNPNIQAANQSPNLTYGSAQAADFQDGQILQSNVVPERIAPSTYYNSAPNFNADVLREEEDAQYNLPQKNIFQSAGNFIGKLNLEDYLPFIGQKSLTGMMGRGIGNLFQNIAPARYGTSQRAYNALTPQGRLTVGSIYGPGGIMSGYNAVSAFGRGPLESITNRISKTRNPVIKEQLITAAKKITDSGQDTSKTGINAVTRKGTYAYDDVNVGGSGTGGSGSKIVCTMMNESYGFGNFRNKIWLKHSKDLPKEYEIGYHTIFLPLINFAKKEGKVNKLVKKTLEHIAKHRTIDLKQEMRGKTHTLGRVYRKILEPICLMVGKIKKAVK